MNFYKLGMLDALEKFADFNRNVHGIPQIPPAVQMAPAEQIPAKKTVAAHPPLAWKQEATAPVVGSQPLPEHEALLRHLGSSVAGGLSMPARGRNVYAGLRTHLL